MDFNFYMPARIVSGEKCIIKNAELLKTLGTKCGIVTGGTSAEKSGALSDAVKALELCNIPYEIYSGIKPNPLTTDCHEAAQKFYKSGVDFILGIGGGSPLDSAKAIAAMTANPHLTPDGVYSMDFKAQPLPIALVGTSAGTGSEVSFVSVLTNTAGRKKSIKGPSLYAKLVFADYTYTSTMPYAVTVSTALDALAHAAEGFLTSKCTDIPTLFAYKGIAMIWESLCWLLENPDRLPDMNMREKLYLGSLYAGIVLNACGTVFPHPMGYVLTENYGIPHGKACAAFMPALIKRADIYEPQKLDALMCLTGETRESFCEKVQKLTDLPEIKMTCEEISAYSERWLTAPNNFTTTPGGFTKDDAEKLLCEMFM